MRSHYVVIVFIILNCLFVDVTGYTQITIPVKDSVGLKSYIIKKGETATLFYDTAYILNKRIFRLYKDTYNKASKGNLAWQQLSAAYTDLVQRQDSLIATKDRYYNSLKLSFDSLANKTSTFLAVEGSGLKEIKDNVKNATADLDSIKNSLNTALDKLKLQKKQKVNLVIGGFAIGVVCTSLIFVAVK
jgi:hypothetical protein